MGKQLTKAEVERIYVGCRAESRGVMMGLASTRDEADRMAEWVTAPRTIGEIAARMQAFLTVFDTMKPRSRLDASVDGHHRVRALQLTEQEAARTALLALAKE